MKVPPKKPHFFKPIKPGFKHGLKIPIGFLKYLKGQERQYAVLRRAGKKWPVKLNGHQLEEGWEKFAEEHDLQSGNMLVFRHEGDMEFEVDIFDSSQCNSEYPEYHQKGGEGREEEVEQEAHMVEKPKNFEYKVSSGNGFDFAEAATHNPFGQSHFVWTVRPYCLSKSYLAIPTRFARANGLTNKNCGLIIRDQRQRSWNLRLSGYGSRVYMIGGWAKFSAANGFKVGDCIMFEVVTNGETPVWKFHVNHVRDKRNPNIKSSRNAFPSAKAATHNPFGYSHFVCTVRPYYLSNDLLYIPKQFALANGLTNMKCNVTIKDERQRSWNLRLHSFGTGACLSGGWHEFRDTKCLKEGDQIMFKVITNGKKPIWQFHGKNL